VTPAASKTYGGVAPTYQMAAQRIMRPHTVFPTTAEEGFVRDAWTDVGKTKMLVNAMRNLLRGESVGPVSTHYSRMQASLPVLVAAMFLAEPARNIRAFPLNLMLLDLAEAGTPLDPIARTTYTMDRILWHPEALDISQDTDSVEARSAPTTTVQGPVGARRAMGQVLKRDKLHLVGGEMPSSPTKGGEKGGVRLDVGTPPDHARDRPQARRGWLEGRLRFQNFDYIHMKEIDVLTRWIARRRPHTFAAVDQDAFVGDTVVVPDWDVLFYGNDQTATDLRDLANAIGRRLDDFDAL
jgi:hypothetical protein